MVLVLEYYLSLIEMLGARKVKGSGNQSLATGHRSLPNGQPHQVHVVNLLRIEAPPR